MSKLDQYLAQHGHGTALTPAWLARDIVIPRAESPGATGKFDPSKNPAVTRLVCAWHTSPARWLVTPKSSQCGMTLHGLLILVHQRVTTGGNGLVISDSTNQSKVLAQRLERLLEAGYKERFAYRRKYDKGKQEKTFKDGQIWALGAGSAGQLASKQAEVVIVDETDKHPVCKGETSSIDLADQRMKSHKHGKLLACSTPTTPTGQIWREYRLCDQVIHYRGKCQKCKKQIKLVDLFNPATSSVACPCCATPITNAQRCAMIKAGKWDKIRKDAKKVGARYSDILSLDINQAVLIEEWEAAQHDVVGLKRVAFYQNRLGMPYDTAKEHEVLQARQIEAALRNATPADVQATGYKIKAIDVQADSYKWLQMTMHATGEHELTINDFGKAETLEEVLRSDDGTQLYVVDDGGHYTWQTRATISEHNKHHQAKAIICKGRKKIHNGLAMYRWTQYKTHKTDTSPSMHALEIGDLVAKSEIYHRVDNTKSIAYPHDAERTKQLLPELLAERPRTITNRYGLTVTEWHSQGKNDWGDCLKMGWVMYQVLAAEHKLPTYTPPDPMQGN